MDIAASVSCHASSLGKVIRLVAGSAHLQDIAHAVCRRHAAGNNISMHVIFCPGVGGGCKNDAHVAVGHSNEFWELWNRLDTRIHALALACVLRCASVSICNDRAPDIQSLSNWASAWRSNAHLQSNQ